MNSVSAKYEELSSPQFVLSTSASGFVDNTIIMLHHVQPHSIIVDNNVNYAI
jgi:hypothetical protein